VYGPHDRALNRFVALARRLPFLPVIGSGEQRVQPVFIDDIARAAADALDSPAAVNGTFEIGGPDVLTMNELLRTMLDVMGKARPLVHIPAVLPRLAGALIGLVPLPDRPISPDAVTFITMDALADTTALRAAFPELRLTPVREGLATYLGPQARNMPPGSAHTSRAP
jgi:uncharacterized protein YbjT (DUF2867 family)